jgi:hypothetical protein
VLYEDIRLSEFDTIPLELYQAVLARTSTKNMPVIR